MSGARDPRQRFAEDYVRVIASAAGLRTYVEDIDDDGIDLGFSLPAASHPALEVRVEAWPEPVRVDGHWAYDRLSETHFNLLAGREFTVPCYLVIVNLHASAAADHEYHTEGVLLRQLAFYRSLADQAPIKDPDPGRTRPVAVPVANLLTARTLHTLCAAP